MAAPERPADSLTAAVASGDQRRALTALRDFLAQQLAETDSKRDVASIAGRLESVIESIAALPAERKGSALDQLAARRAGRDGVASRQVRTRRVASD